MTHSVGDNGQRYEVSFYDPQENGRRVFDWSNKIESAIAMANSIEAHPSFTFPQIRDREAEEFKKIKDQHHD